MSMIIFMEKMQNGDIENNKVSVVNKKRDESLSDFVRRVRNEKGYSLDKVQQLSLNSINASYVSRIENGQVLQESITAKKLRALAKGLGVPEEEIFAVARGKTLNTEEAFTGEFGVLFKAFHDLSPTDQAEVMATVRMLAAEVERRRPRKQPSANKGKK